MELGLGISGACACLFAAVVVRVAEHAAGVPVGYIGVTFAILLREAIRGSFTRLLG